MKFQSLIYFLLLSMVLFAQEEEIKKVPIDSLYREDQFYVNITYNSLRNMPAGLSQNGFSPGLTFGFLRDFPINKERNIAFAPGLGFSFLGINQNLVAEKVNDVVVFDIGNENEFDRNRLSLFLIEAPLEVRWRTSTPESHKFWRIYAGFKAGYVFYNKLKLTADTGNNTLKNLSEIQKLQLSTYVTFGFNTWNFYMLYGFTPIYDASVRVGTEPVKMGLLNLGLQFYIL